jgi:hypothetical protein
LISRTKQLAGSATWLVMRAFVIITDIRASLVVLDTDVSPHFVCYSFVFICGFALAFGSIGVWPYEASVSNEALAWKDNRLPFFGRLS